MKSRHVIIGAGLLLGAISCMKDGAPTAPSTQTPIASRHEQVGAAPTLLACPSTGTQTVTGVVGVLGGSLSLGSTKIDIPLGAVLEPTLFQIVIPESPYMEVDVHAVGLTSFLFKRPVQITIDYSRCSDAAIPAGAQLQGVYIDGQTNTVLEQMGGVDDHDSRRITFSTPHLSGYAVAY